MWMEGVRRLGAHQHPEITLTGAPMAEALDDWERGDLAVLRAFFMRDAKKRLGVKEPAAPAAAVAAKSAAS